MGWRFLLGNPLDFPTSVAFPDLMPSPDRDAIFSRVRQALQPLKDQHKQTAYPDWDDAIARSKHAPAADLAARTERFRERLTAVHGLFHASLAETCAYLRDTGVTRGYVDPALLEAMDPALLTGLTVETDFDRTRIDDYGFGLTRAAGAIAESGTIILKDTITPARLAALAPWVHAAVVHPDTLYATPGDALEHLGDDPSIIWATGPSKTADVEGILIEGVHGPGVQIACLTEEVPQS